MKVLNVMTLALAAFGGFAAAQDAPAAPATKLIVSVMNNKRWMTIPSLKAQGKNVVFINPQTTEPAAMPVRAPYLLHTPKELDSALVDYRGGDLAAAMKQLEQVRGKYAEYRELDGNPSLLAAMTELDCAMRLQNWAHLAQVGDAIAAKTYGDLTARQIATVQAARYVAQAMTGAAADPTKAKGLYDAILKQQSKYAALSNTGTVENIGLRPYSWYCYCLGRLAEAQIPEAQLSGTIAADAIPVANEAIDRYCQAAVALHGAAPELAGDATMRALKLLNAMPGVKEYTKTASAAGQMDAATWNKAPNDFKDAVAMAHLIKTVYAPDVKDSLVDSLAALYFKPQPKAE